MVATIVQWNCHGYKTRYRDLRTLLQEYQPSCVSLQETMLGDYCPLPPQGYNIEAHSTTPNPVPGSGLALLVKNNVGYQRLHLNSQLKVLAVRAGIKENTPVTICNIYISPQEPLVYQDLLDLVSELPRPFVLNGDLNSRHTLWGDTVCNQHGRVMERLLMSTDLCLLNTGLPTHLHVQTCTSTAIDLSLCSPEIFSDIIWSTADDLYGSDHYPIIMEMNTRQPQLVEPRYILKRADWEAFEALSAVHEDYDDFTAEDTERSLIDKLKIAASIAIPRSKGGMMEHRVPWYNDECKIAKIERRAALRRYLRTKTLADQILYKRARARAQFVQLKAKQSSWIKYVSSINKDTPMKKIWNRVSKMRGKLSHRAPCLTVGGVVTADPTAVANILAENFADVSSGHHYPPRFMAVKGAMEREQLDFSDDNQEYYNDPITITEVWQAIQKSKNTAPGPDGIHYKMLKRMHPTALRAMLKLFNKIWTTHDIPRQWKTTTVLPFLKPGKPISDPSSYRPITLSSCMGKLLEKIVNTRLMAHLESRGLIAREQFGFRRNRGTVDALVRLQNDVHLSRKNGNHTICVFFDMHKAYDTTWRYGILRSLHRMGIRGNMAQYCKEFLSHRHFNVRSGGASSRTMTQIEGVPQGSVISCTLFIVALNDIVRDLPMNVRASMYVDDLMIYSSSRYVPALARRMQETINKVDKWATRHGFMFSSQKTVALLIRSGRRRIEPPRLFLKDEPITFRNQAKFLGMIVDDRLSWIPHLKAIKTDCVRRLDLIKCLSRLTWGADRTSLLMLYRASIRSRIDYGSIVYQAARKTALAMIDPVHNSALRLCTGAFRSSPVVSILAESGEPSLELRRAQLTYQYTVRLLQLPGSPCWTSVNLPELRNEEIFPYYFPSSIDYQALTTDIGLRHLQVLPARFEAIPVWCIPAYWFCPHTGYPKKNEANTVSMRWIFQEHIAEKHQGAVHVFTDGSKTGEQVGCAAVSHNEVVLHKLLPESSIFTAELFAILIALEHIVRPSHERKFAIFSDSRAALQAIRSLDTNHPILNRILLELINTRRTNKEVQLCWVPGHVDVPGNDKADEKAREAATSDGRPLNNGVPCRDYYPFIKGAIMNHWQSLWTEIQTNKLRTIKESVRPWSSSYNRDRRMEVVLCRLRIGHTLLTHSFLMERRPPPFCMDCIVPLTVEHIVAECPSYAETRRRYFPHIANDDPTTSLKEILSEHPRQRFDYGRLKLFLSETQLLNKI